MANLNDASAFFLVVYILLCTVGRCQVHLQNNNSAGGNERPPYNEYAARARYMVHKANWAMLNTISAQPGMEGYAFGNVMSISDGLPDNSTGIPYIYLSPLDVSYQDLQVQNKVTLAFSEAEFPDVDDCKISSVADPESPLCTRLVLLGSMAHITDASELEFAKKVLFTRHPVMPSWPSSHQFTYMKLMIQDIWMIDYFGGGVHVSVDKYFNAKI